MTSWYVSNTGNDANAGTISQPVRTIYQAYYNANNNDTIYITSGIYFWNDNGAFSNSNNWVTNAGWVFNKSGITISGLNSPIVTMSTTGQWTYYPAGDSAHGHGNFGACWGISLSGTPNSGSWFNTVNLYQTGTWPAYPMMNTYSISGLSIYNAGNGFNINDRLCIGQGLINGAVGGITIKNSGVGYSNTNNIAFTSGNGTQCSGNILTNGGQVTGIIITNPGMSYQSGDNLGIPGGAAYFQVTGLGGSCQFMVTGINGLGAVTGIQLLSSGTGYGLQMGTQMSLTSYFTYPMNASCTGQNLSVAPTAITNPSPIHFAHPELINSSNYYNLTQYSLVDTNNNLLNNTYWYDTINQMLYFKTGYTNLIPNITSDPSQLLYIGFGANGSNSQQVHCGNNTSDLTIQGIRFYYMGAFHFDGVPNNNFIFRYNEYKYSYAMILGGNTVSNWIIEYNIFDKSNFRIVWGDMQWPNYAGGYGQNILTHYIYYNNIGPSNMYVRYNIFSRNAAGYAVQFYPLSTPNIVQYNNIYMDNLDGGPIELSGVAELTNCLALGASGTANNQGSSLPYLKYGANYGVRISNNYLENNTFQPNGVETFISGVTVENNITYNNSITYPYSSVASMLPGYVTTGLINIRNNIYIYRPTNPVPFYVYPYYYPANITQWQQTGINVLSISNFETGSISITGGILPTTIYPGSGYMDNNYSINKIFSDLYGAYNTNIAPNVTGAGPNLNIIGRNEVYPINGNPNINIFLMASGHSSTLAFTGYNLAIQNSGGTFIWDVSGSPTPLITTTSIDNVYNNIAYNMAYTSPNTGVFSNAYQIGISGYSGIGIAAHQTGTLVQNIPSNFELNTGSPISWVTFGAKTVMISGSGTSLVWDCTGLSPQIIAPNTSFIASDGISNYTINRSY